MSNGRTVRHKLECRENSKVRMVPSAGQAVGCTKGIDGPLGLTQRQLERAVFFHDYHTGPENQNVIKKAMVSVS